MFVPFGKLECFGSGQLALLTANCPAAGCPAVSMAWHTASALGGPCQALIREGGGYNGRPASKASFAICNGHAWLGKGEARKKPAGVSTLKALRNL